MTKVRPVTASETQFQNLELSEEWTGSLSWHRGVRRGFCSHLVPMAWSLPVPQLLPREELSPKIAGLLSTRSRCDAV